MAERMKNILALDLGTTTGFAAGRAGAMVSGVWNLKPGRFDGGGMRYLKFRARLDEIVTTLPFEGVFFEEVRRHRGTDAAHVYGGLMATLTAWCEEHKIPYDGVPVGSIKSYATGKGNADKERMKEAVRTWGYETDDDNEADAIALFWLKMAELGFGGMRPEKKAKP